ncbi:membrane bound O-acyl transferase family-domain-containing protein [Roridomyces roridus]|uniref:Membrane bound O-acyl transferase family-domain-containing protein n=1 Tax=Roridomyces roridus TaxID=1738132 RepID=A0AAD7BPD0_9AGAR|nr:membrane bound O-acyl transferase family-domain-containing protein [Roridomyces roridus]
MAPSLHPFNPSLLGLYSLLILVPLVVRPSPYRPLCFIPILALTAYVLCFTSTGTFEGDYYLSIQWLTYFFAASDYILLTDVQRELRQVSLNPASSVDKRLVEERSLWDRTRLALSLLSTPRGIGWAHEPRHNIPAHPPASTPRTTFICKRLLCALTFFLMHDAANLHVRWNEMYRADGRGWMADGWAWRAVACIGYGASAYSAIEMIGILGSVLSVVVGVSRPEEWPMLFGGPREAWTIRRFWSRAWHQMLHRSLSAHGKFLAHKMLGLTPGTLPSLYIRLYTGFFISALLHYGAESMALHHLRGRALSFFMLQAVGITLEDVIFRLARKTPLGRLEGSVGARLVGYAWTLGWFALVLPYWQEPLVRAGLTDGGIPISLIMGVVKGEWILEPLASNILSRSRMNQPD